MKHKILSRAAPLVSLVLLMGCDFMAPCDLRSNASTMSGSWRLVAVDGKPIPQTGVPIPGSTERLTSGDLFFDPVLYRYLCDDVTEDDDPFGEEGRITSVYNRANSAGQSLPTEVFTGKYKYEHVSSQITLQSKTREVSGRRVINEMTFSGYVPIFGDNHTLLFLRTSVE